MALTIRPNKEEQLVIEKLKKLLGEKSSSKALLIGAVIVVDDYEKLKEEYAKLHERYIEVNNVLRLLSQKNEIEKEIISLTNKLIKYDNRKA